MFIIDNLRFENTCIACPEQYDVYHDGEQTGYVRLRYGKLRCDFPDCGDETIYEHIFDDPWKGEFETNEERMCYLQNCADAINEKLNGK